VANDQAPERGHAHGDALRHVGVLDWFYNEHFAELGLEEGEDECESAWNLHGDSVRRIGQRWVSYICCTYIHQGAWLLGAQRFNFPCYLAPNHTTATTIISFEIHI
jgi:hypothetical protein